MVNLLIVKNPFDKRADRKQVAYVPGHSVFDYIYPQFMLPESEIEVFYGGRQLTELQMRSIIVRPDDYIVAMPKIAGGGDDNKSILLTVASIGLMMVSGVAGNWVTAATSAGKYATALEVAKAGGMAVWNFWGYAAALGVQVAGGYLLNYYAQKRAKEIEQGSPTYSWDGVQPLIGQGQPVPVVFGTVRAAGQIIAQHVISDGTKQYLNLLIQCAEGPCDYTQNGENENCIGISNIEINNNPLNNYTGITVYKRAGLNNQSVIPNFENTRIEQAINIELKYDSQWHMFTTTGDTGSGIELTFSLPALYDQEYKGTKRWENEIRIEIEYKLHNETNWIRHYNLKRESVRYDSQYRFESQHQLPLSIGELIYLVRNGELMPATITATGSHYYYELGYYYLYYWYEVNVQVPTDIREIARVLNYDSIAGKHLTAFSHVVRINTGTVGQYDVRCRCIYKYAYGSEDAHTIYWAKLAHVVYDDFTYPNKTLLSIQALANDKISGSANVTFELSRSNVWVWVPNNPDLDPWGPGSYQEKPANNPAWAAYWLNHRVYRFYNINTGQYEFIVRGAPANRMIYSEFKDWADFCTERGIEVNVYIDTIQKLREAMQIFEDIGRGRVLPKGTKIGCMFDGPAEKDLNGDIVYSQVLNVANIGLDSFSEQWVDVSERATAIEVTFWDKDNEHEKTTMLVPADGLTEGTATGNVTQLTIQASVPRLVAWKYCKYKLRLNNYINNTVNITTSVNAIVSGLGQVIGVQHDVPQWGFGGRVQSATTTTITLDKLVTMETGKIYSALFWLNNDTKIEKIITTVPGETSILTVSEAFVNDTLTAEYVDPTHFQVDGDQTASFIVGQLVQLYHSTGDQTDYVISTVYNSSTLKTIVEITNCPVGLLQARFAWTMPHENDQWLFGPVESGVKKHSRPFKIIGFTRENDLTYRITAVNYEDAVYTESETVPNISYGLIEPIFEIDSLSVKEETFQQKDGTLVSQLNISWTVPIGKTADRFLVYYSEDGGLTWFFNTDTIDTKTIITNVKTGMSYLVKVVVVKDLVTSSGIISDPVTIIGKNTMPSDVPSFTLTQSGSTIRITIEEPDDPDIDHYELRLGPSWENSVHIKNLFLPNDTIPATQEGTQTFWVKAIDYSGLKSANPTKNIIIISGLPPKNIVAERTENLATWQTTGMFYCYQSNCWLIDSQAKIGDFAYFADIFASDGGAALRIDAEAILPPLDVGPSIIPEGYFYYSPYDRQIQLYTTHDGVNPATLDDYVDFWGLFAEIPVYLQPPSKFETTATVDIDWLQSSNNYISIYYRTSFDGISYNDWHYMENHQFFGRYIQVKLKPGSLDGKTNVRICGCRLAVDVPDVTEKIPVTAVNATGITRVNLINRYWAAPFVKIYSQDTIGKSCTYEIVDGTAKQDVDRSWYFEIRLWDGATQIAGKIYGEVEGY